MELGEEYNNALSLSTFVTYIAKNLSGFTADLELI